MTAPRSVVSEAEIEELRKLAEAATPGPWIVDDIYTDAVLDSRHLMIAACEDVSANAAFIAALNPATVLRILADREAAEASARRLEASHAVSQRQSAEAIASRIPERMKLAEVTVRLEDAEALLREACDSRAPDYADAEHPGWARRARAFLSTGKPSKAKETA